MIKYSKYSSCGNDFIIIDNRNKLFKINHQYINKLCDRKNGIGADGLILLCLDDVYSYHMKYFNSDGYQSSFCGNGSMCCGHFALSLGLFNSTNNSHGLFSTDQGVFKINAVLNNDYGFGEATISMTDVLGFKDFGNDILINSGSPHYLVYSSDIELIDVEKKGRAIRNSDKFIKNGVNVTFISIDEKNIYIRTYERGVEAETLSCGTGAVASALFLRIKKLINTNIATVNTKGGPLIVSFNYEENKFTDILLKSSFIKKAFDGVLKI